MPETTDRRAMLAEAFNRSTEEEAVEAPEAPEVETPEEPAEPEAAATPAEGGEGEEHADETPEQKAARERDEKGRFTEKPAAPKAAKPTPKPEKAPKPAPAVAAKPAAVAAAPAKPAAPVGPDLKPPQSWTAQAREAWKDLPPVAKQEIHRLEGETRRVLQENSGLRKTATEAGQFQQQVSENLRPWEGIFRAEGMDPISGAMSVVQTYGTLHYGAPQQKAQILLGLIQRFSTFDDINAVAEAVAQGRAPAPSQPQQFRQAPAQPAPDPRALVREEFQNLQQQAVTARAERDYDAFLATEPEFLEDVAEEMQTILDSSAARGRNLTYQEAYARACKMNDGVQSIMQQREQAAAIAQPSATAQRARVAAATVRSRPVTASGPDVDPTDRRAMLQRAAERR